jgi:hypothetical protein
MISLEFLAIVGLCVFLFTRMELAHRKGKLGEVVR